MRVKKRRRGRRGAKFELRRACLALGIPEAEVVRRTGLTRAMVSGLCNGRVCPAWPTALRIAEALEVSLDVFRTRPEIKGGDS